METDRACVLYMEKKQKEEVKGPRPWEARSVPIAEEAQQYTYFVCLTYGDEYVPRNPSISIQISINSTSLFHFEIYQYFC